MIFKPGLQKTPRRKQKYSFGAIFGYPDPKTLPNEYKTGDPLEIKDQGTTQTCVMQSLCSVSEYQEGLALEPAYTAKVVSEIVGNSDWINRGVSLETGAKSALKGFLSREDSPFTIEKHGISYTAEPANWNKTYDEIAKVHAKRAWFWIGTSGQLKMFDAIRGALWRFRSEKRAAQTGVMWNDIWTSQTYIKEKGRKLGGHAIAVIGWQGDYLIIQNSYGKSIGENGLQYFHKDIVNKLFKYGALMFADIDEDHETIIKKSKRYRNLFLRIIQWLLRFFLQ